MAEQARAVERDERATERGGTTVGESGSYESVSAESNVRGVPLARRPAIGHAPSTPGEHVERPQQQPLGGNVVAGHQRTKVLILARESVIAALLGMLLELEEYEPVFAEAGERPEDAIHRHRPPLIVILDGDLDAAGSDLFYARASAAGASVVLFSEPLAAEDVRAVARQRRLPFLSMPTDRDTLGRILERTRG
jgi:hypothetical protein